MNEPNPDDRALYEAWRSGDKRAGEVLFERYFDAIYRFFESKAKGDVGDLVQRTFLGTIEARDRFRGASSFRTFLYAIARNELYGFYRSRRREGALDFGVSSVADLAPGPSTFVRRRSERERLVAALESMPVDLQLAIELRYWEGLSGPDLAVVLEIAEGTVRSRLRRALEALRDALATDEDGRGLLAPLSGGSEEDLDGWASRLHARLRPD